MIWIVSGVYTQQIGGVINIANAIKAYDVSTVEEAIGRFVVEKAKEYPNHTLCLTPIAMSLDEAKAMTGNK